MKSKQHFALAATSAGLILTLFFGLAFVFLPEGPNANAAFSGAALANQPLSELSETDTQELSKERGKPLEELTDKQKKLIADLQAALDLDPRQVRSALEILGGANVPPQLLAAKLADIAQKFKDLKLAASMPPGGGSEIAALNNQVEDAVNAGDLGRADDLLATKATVETLAPELTQGKGLERLAPNAARTIARRGAVALARLQYLDSARHFADAAHLLPETNEYTEQRFIYLNSEASALYQQGDEFGDTAVLTSAIAKYTHILELLPRSEGVPVEWARTKANIGNVLASLGEREIGTGRLEEAVGAYREALKQLPKEHVPLDWAKAQNDLGVALQKLGERENGTGWLRDAVAAYREALTERTRKLVPQDWAMTQRNLGDALEGLGERENGTARLNEAVATYREALQEFTSEGEPVQQARTQTQLGKALENIGKRESGTERLEEAIGFYREALAELSQGRQPVEWAGAKSDLDDALRRLRDREAGTARSTAIGFIERWWRWLVGVQGLLLLIINAVVLARARWSAAAWRIATDDSWGTAVFRLSTIVLRHWTIPQLWILDLYVQKQRIALPSATPFLPLPLAGPDGLYKDSDKLMAELPARRRLWVQGGSGMGKTALIRNLTETHFRTATSAFVAYRRDRYVLVPIAARRFAEAGGEDKRDPAWLIDCVRAVLSSNGLTFENDALLRAILRKGTLAVAVDGLNEVARDRSVEAFTDAFENSPVLVTSQDEGGDRFQTWHLPLGIGEYTEQLLSIYLGERAGKAVFARIQACGLGAYLLSGYDVRLVVDLTREDPENAPLPIDRLGLYGRVVDAAWPQGGQGQRQTQQAQLEAAAWKLVSEREPYEDKRRLKPDVDLSSQLLTALADVPDKHGRSVRLVRSIGPDFEFVHDQMNAYLAARWYAIRERSVAEMRQMISDSKIWKDTKEVQRTLWGFVGGMLNGDMIQSLWAEIRGEEPWDTLRRALESVADEQDLELKVVRKQPRRASVQS